MLLTGWDLLVFVVALCVGIGIGIVLGFLLHQKIFGMGEKVTESNKHINEQIAETHRQEIVTQLAPLREQIDGLRGNLKDQTNTSKNLSTNVLAQIQTHKTFEGRMVQMHKDRKKISLEAENLTNALKGSSQKRGQWGEMILKRTLELSGLQEGKEYFLQPSSTDKEEGKLYRPDAVIHFPDKKSVIVDSKVSLLNYEQYTTHNDEQSLNNFISAVQKQMKSLSEKHYPKNYQDESGSQIFEYILMFIPIESAYMLAMEKDKQLFESAMKSKVILVSPTLISLALQTIYHAWQTDRQNKYAQEIAKEGGRLYDKFAGFLDDMNKHGTQITSAQKSYDDAMNKLRYGQGSIYRKIEKLKELGVKSTKFLPKL